MAVGALPTADVFLHGAYDVDRADYLQRDAIHSGVAYGRFDVERLLGPGLTIPAVKPEDISTRPDPRSTPSIDYMKGLVALENMMVGRDQMYFTVFYHPTCLLIAEAFYDLAAGKWRSAGNRAVQRYVEEHVIRIESDDAKKRQFDRLGRMVGFFQLMDCEDFDFMHTLRGAGRAGEEAKALLNRRQHKKVCVLSWAQLRPDRRPSDSLPVRRGTAARRASGAVDLWLKSDAGNSFRKALEDIEYLLSESTAWKLPTGKTRWFSTAYSPQEPEVELEVIVARKHLLPSATEWSFASEVSPFLAAIAPAHRRNRILCIGLHPDVARLLDPGLCTDLGLEQGDKDDAGLPRQAPEVTGGADDAAGGAAGRIKEAQDRARAQLMKGIELYFSNRQ